MESSWPLILHPMAKFEPKIRSWHVLGTWLAQSGTLVAMRHHCDTIATPETMTLIAIQHHRDTIATLRIGLVAVVSQYAKLVCNYWNVGRTATKIGRNATKQNKVELLGPMACFWWALGARDGPKGVSCPSWSLCVVAMPRSTFHRYKINPSIIL